ncbi:hypothetical protein ACOTCJ_20965 [Achromobacter xylosoxidans]
MTSTNNTIRVADKDIHEEFERRYAMDADDPASAIELGHFANGWRAAVSKLRVPVAGEPFMYGIMGPDGKAHFEEFCVSGDRAELQTEVVDHLNRDNPEDGTYSVVALFREAPPQGSGSDFAKLRSAYVGTCDQIAELLAEKQASVENAPAAGEAQHPDDIAVDSFAVAMKAKLAKKRAEGRGGWSDTSQCTAEFLSQLLRGHVDKGDPVDVGNLAMMLHQRGDCIAPYKARSSVGAQPVTSARPLGYLDCFGIFYRYKAFANMTPVYASANAPQASAEQLVRYCPGCGSVGPVGDEYRDCCPDGGEARTIPAPLAEKCRDTFKIAVKALRADAAANEAMANQVPAVTEEYTLRAMARNYTDRHSWDKLDSKAVTAAADEIRALRAALAARAQLPENGDAHG